MKKIILILVTSIFTVSGFAQQFPLQSQYRYNYSSINPAAVGAKDYFSIRASARNQWVNFGEKDISTEYITFTNGFGNSGVGLTMMNDETGGFYSSTGFKLAYSHKVIVSESEFYFGSHRIAVPQSELFLGISGGGSKYNSIDACFKREENFVNISYNALNIFSPSKEKSILQNLTSFSLERSF